MSTLTEDQLFELSDEELEAAFREAKAEAESPDVEPELDTETDEDVEEIEEDENSDEVDEIVEDEDEDEEEVEELEQPDDQDSDDDTSSDDEDGEESEEDSEEEDGKPDEEPEATDENTDEEEEDSEEEGQPVQDEILSFKANGQEYEFTVDEMKTQFGKVFGQAMDYTKKMQALKPYRKTVDAIEQAGISGDDVNLMIDVLKGDKDAIAAVIKRTGVNALELDTEGESNYVAKDYGRNETELDIKEVVESISMDKEYTITHNVLEKQWDDKSREAFVEDPNMIRLLHTDVKSGMFDTINPIAQKLKVYDGASKSDLDYYKEAAQEYFKNQAQAEATTEAREQAKVAAEQKRQEQAQAAKAAEVVKVKANQAKRVETKKASAKRKAAAPTKKAAGTKGVVDYLDESDDSYDSWYNDLMENH